MRLVFEKDTVCIVFCDLLNPENSQQVLGVLLHLAFRFFGYNLRQKNVLPDRQLVQQHKVLKDKAELVLPYFCKLIFLPR